MTTNHHTVIATGAAANASVFNAPMAQLDSAITANALLAAATTAEVVAARAAYPNLGTRLDDLILSGGNVATKANGVSAAGQKVLTVDSTTGFIVGAYVTYLLNGATLEGNTIASIQAGVSLTLGTNIGATPAGGVLDDSYISMISLSEYQAAQAIPHAGTLMLSQTMEYANGGVYNPDAFYVAGDVDDSARIQRALDAAIATKGTCELSKPSYLLGAPLTVTGPVDGVRLVGTGKTILKTTGNFVPIQFKGATSTAKDLAASVAVGDMTVTLESGGGATFDSNTLALVNDGVSGKVELWDIASVSTDTLNLRRASRYAWSHAGATKSVTLINGIRDLVIDGINFETAGAHAIEVQYACGVTIRNCTVSSYTSSGPAIHIVSCLDVDVSNNEITGGDETGIFVFTSGDVRISNNSIHDIGYPGIILYEYVSGFSVTGNIIKRCKTYGIFVCGYCANGNVANNVIGSVVRIPGGVFDSNACGIVAQTQVKNVAFVGNNVANCNTGIYLAMNCDYCTVTGNTVRNCRKGDAVIQVAGIYLDTDCNYNNVTGNSIFDVDQVGIAVHTTCHFNVISSNSMTAWKVESAQGVGILVDAGSIGNHVTGNLVAQITETAGSIGIHIDNATKSLVIGNTVRTCAAPIVLSGTTDLTTVLGNNTQDNTTAASTFVGAVYKALNFPDPSHEIFYGVLEAPGLYTTGEIQCLGALNHDGTHVGFYGTAPVAKQTGVAVSAAGVHAALVALGLISA